jgi:putative ATPase
MDSLFPEEDAPAGAAPAPLAERMRPRTFDEFVGQADLLAPGKPLREAIERDLLQSIILWGPPGTGKTTLARIIADITKARFISFSAVLSGIKEIRDVMSEAQRIRRTTGRRSIVFIDEIHRFNKAQQDAILPHVEDGTVTLIGATTENPSFEVISALLSRTRVFVLHALTEDQIAQLVERALTDEERGLGNERIALDDDARSALVRLANGDARVALSTLEFAASAAKSDPGGVKRIDVALVADALQRRMVAYDKKGEYHYDVISAFIKSIRGSDPDAAVYWLARMLDAGEDILFIARRLVILASEDVGLADSRGLQVAIAAQQAAHFVGMPEAFYPLAHATLYLALAPKSNSVGRAYGAALADVEGTRNDPVPLHLRNAPTGLMRQLGYGRDYIYSHDDYEADQTFLPPNVAGHHYYDPGKHGEEQP